MATVLIVDDEIEAAGALKMFFDLQDVTCWTANNSEQALRTIAEQKPQVIFLDIQLKGSALDGFGILQKARENNCAAKIYMVTGFDDEASRIQAQELAADGYLCKPLLPEKLMEIVRKLG